MPPPVDLDDLHRRIDRSGLAPTSDVAEYIAGLTQPAGGWTPPDLLEQLVAGRLLTSFQADCIAAGKYKGFVLGPYVILDKIGGGGMGQVYLAEHAEMRRLVAVKVLPVPVGEDTVARERFLREARAVAALNHPNIIRVHDLNREGRLLYLVMEYLVGLNLHDLVQRIGKLSAPFAVHVTRQIALALQHAHELGLVHRDVKPANVMIGPEGNAKLLDLGLVRSEADVDSKLTAQYGNAILGTADYLAPEQAVDSSKVDIRADIYSLGATAYYLFAGRPLFPDGRTGQKLMWQQWKEPTHLMLLRPDLPDGLADVIHKAVAKKREHRWQTPQEFLDALADFPAACEPLDVALLPALPQRRWMATSTEAAPEPTDGSSSCVHLAARTPNKTSLTGTRLNLRSDLRPTSGTGVILGKLPVVAMSAGLTPGRISHQSRAPETKTGIESLTVPDNVLEAKPIVVDVAKAKPIRLRRRVVLPRLTAGLAVAVIVAAGVVLALLLPDFW